MKLAFLLVEGDENPSNMSGMSNLNLTPMHEVHRVLFHMTCMRLLLVLSSILSLPAWSQTASVKGRVLDAATNEPIPFANVFLNNTTLGAASDDNGEFVIKGIKQPAPYELVVSFVGYDRYSTRLSITAAEMNLGIIKLTPANVQLNQIEVSGTRDAEWERKMKKFTKIFLGNDAQAAECKIVNPWVVNFQAETGSSMIATAKEPIIIENNALGYVLSFYLKQFVATQTSYSITGDVRFENQISSNWDMLKKWEESRQTAFFGSSQHLFKSMVNKRIQGEGYSLYQPLAGFEKTRSSLFSADLDKTLFSMDTTQWLSASEQKHIFRISWTGALEVHYRKQKAPAVVYQDIRYPISWITLKKGVLLVNSEGVVLNPADVVISGAMSESRVAHMLPLDYTPLERSPDDLSPEQRSSYDYLFEKIYIHTDKPYYYSGETVWMKGYVNYSSPYFRDSLSTVVYAELLLAKSKKSLQQLALEIDSGSFQGDFILPDTLKPGDYFIRAYTNWNRNYGDDHLYVKYLPVLALDQRPEAVAGPPSNLSEKLEITTDQKTYFIGDEMTIRVKLSDTDDLPLYANLSVSITDANQVLPVNTPTIVEAFPIAKVPATIQNPVHQLEYGLSVRGQVTFSRSKTQQGMIHVFQPGSGNFYLAESDPNGIFQINGLHFYGPSSFIVQPGDGTSSRKREILSIKLQPRKVPDLFIPGNHVSLSLQKAGSAQREVSSFELPAHTRLLQEVVVRETAEEAVNKERPYGKPDYVMEGESLNQGYGNLLLSLQGKVPGLMVRQDPNGQWLIYVQRAGSSSINNAKSVLVMVNDVFVSGNSADILSSINVADVETVEVKTGISVLYGGMGGSGIVSVYTRQGARETTLDTKRQQSFTVEGFYRPRAFPIPKSGTIKSGDYRSLLYWNPMVNTSRAEGVATVRCFTSDLPGPYRIVVEGVTEKGTVVRGEKLIQVLKKQD